MYLCISKGQAIELVKGLPFDRICVMVNSQEFTKISNCWNITNGRKGTNTNRIVLPKRT